MKNKSPLGSDFEKFIRNALQKTKNSPDENIWANIASKQQNRNIWLRVRHYGIRFTPIIVAIILAIAGWKYYTAQIAPSANNPLENGVQQPFSPTEQPQVYIDKPSSSTSENVLIEEIRGKNLSAHLKSPIPATSVRFLAEEGLSYENPASGTSVYIPANALINKDGRAATGEVEFQLREYRSIADYLASGIPMHYADERGSYFFNSGGMFDIRVYQRGEPLKMAEGQACDLRFTSTHKLTQPSLYYFDESNCTWKYQPDPAFTTSELPPVVTEATAARDNQALLMDCLPSQSVVVVQGFAGVQPSGDEAANWMQIAVQTGYDYTFGKQTMPGWFKKHPDWTNEQLLSGLEQSLIRMKRHKDSEEKFFPEDMNNVFTELKAFKGCYFIINEGLGSKKSFTKEEFDSYWERVSVVQQKGSICYVSFFGKQGLLQFYATLMGSTENENFDADKVMAEYNRLRNERQQNFEKQANAWRRFTQMAQIFQEPNEWCMDATTWFDYFDANLPLMRKRYAALKEQGIADDSGAALKAWNVWEKRKRDIYLDNYGNKKSLDRRMARADALTYALRVTQFGLYNCDQIYRLLDRFDDGIFIYAAYKNAEGQRIVPQSVSIMERRTRFFATLPDSEYERMVYAPGRKLDIIVTGMDGHFYRFAADKYGKTDLKGQKSYTFTVEKVTEKTFTPRDWAELLEI